MSSFGDFCDNLSYFKELFVVMLVTRTESITSPRTLFEGSFEFVVKWDLEVFFGFFTFFVEISFGFVVFLLREIRVKFAFLGTQVQLHIQNERHVQLHINICQQN